MNTKQETKNKTPQEEIKKLAGRIDIYPASHVLDKAKELYKFAIFNKKKAPNDKSVLIETSEIKGFKKGRGSNKVKNIIDFVMHINNDFTIITSDQYIIRFTNNKQQG